MGEKKKENGALSTILKLNKLIRFFLVALLITPLLMLIAFGYSIEWEIPNDIESWTAIGTLLSGTFGMVASLTAVISIIVITVQLTQQTAHLTQQRDVAKKQIDSIEFDRYDRHRRIFFERLEGIETLRDNKIKVLNKESLYHQVFFNNTPLNCDVVMPVDETGKTNDLKAMILKLDKIKKAIKRPEIIDLNFLHELYELEVILKLAPNNEWKDGDLIYNNFATTINLYDLQMTFMTYFAFINSMLVYSGNDELDKNEFMINSKGNVTKAAIRISNHIKNIGNGKRFKIHASRKSINTYEEIYLFFSDNRSIIYTDKLFKKTNDLIMSIFHNGDKREQYTTDGLLIEQVASLVRALKIKVKADTESAKRKYKEWDGLVGKLEAWEMRLASAAKGLSKVVK